MCGRIKRSAISPPRDAGGGASSEARPESSYRFKPEPKFILVVAEEFIATNACRYGMNLPEVLVGDMNEVYQTAHIDYRLVVSLRSISNSGRDPWVTRMNLIICHLELHNSESVEMHP